MDTQNKQKHHWLDDVKWHNPDYKWDWASAVWSWHIVAIFVGFWILVNILPWNAIGQIPGYSDLSQWMNDFMPRYKGLPPGFRYIGLEEQFAFINVFGLIWLAYILFKTDNFPITRKEAPWWTAPVLCFFSAFMFIFFIFFLVVEPSDISVMSDVEIAEWYAQKAPPSQWKYTLYLIFYWYAGMGAMLVFTIASFRTSISQFYKFLRR